MADAKWSELTMGGVVCLLHVILLQMILAAIEGLSSKNGSNKSAISKYMEGKFGKLPSLSHTHTHTADRASSTHKGA